MRSEIFADASRAGHENVHPKMLGVITLDPETYYSMAISLDLIPDPVPNWRMIDRGLLTRRTRLLNLDQKFNPEINRSANLAYAIGILYSTQAAEYYKIDLRTVPLQAIY